VTSEDNKTFAMAAKVKQVHFFSVLEKFCFLAQFTAQEG
jgi:hypothetical protein